MSHHRCIIDRIAWLAGAAVCLLAARVPAEPIPPKAPPVKVEIREAAGKYQLYVGGQPFYVKGAGLEFGSIEKLAAHGANSFRTWRTDNGRQSGRQVLNAAAKNGLYVTMGLDLGLERHGFDYNDPVAVARQLTDIKAQVLRFKNHPALIMWAIGNELNLNSTNVKVWDAVNDISKMIHQVDPNHLTLTPLAGISPELIHELKTHSSDLDLIGIQMYADIVTLPARLRESGWTGPYLVTEWGATGHWEVPKTEWGAPIENDSTLKADLYLQRYQTAIASDTNQCVGSYVFLWGSKQERTPTWYGMFLDSGEQTATVDALSYIWNGAWPASVCPRVESVSLDGKTAAQNIRLQPSQTYSASARITSAAGPLRYHWEILDESGETKVGGDVEARPQHHEGLIDDPAAAEIHLRAPEKTRAYRLFVYAYDGHGRAAHANLPFFVNPPLQAHAATP